MVIFDMDGVLTAVDSSWQTIHEAFGVTNDKNFAKHLRNEISYSEFMRSDIRLWGRVHISTIKDILDHVPLMKGAREILAWINYEGIATAIISSGISLLAERIKKELGITYVFSNRLLTDSNGHLSEEGEGIVTLRNKGIVLDELCLQEGINPDDCVVIGDSRYDVPLFDNAGLSIAFNPKDSYIMQVADLTIEDRDLRKIQPYLNVESRACISLVYASEREASIVAQSLAPDNLMVPKGLIIKSQKVSNTVKIRIFSVKDERTLLATIDDLLMNIQISEQALNILKE